MGPPGCADQARGWRSGVRSRPRPVASPGVCRIASGGPRRLGSDGGRRVRRARATYERRAASPIARGTRCPDGTRYSRSFGTKMDAEALARDGAVADRPRRVDAAERRARLAEERREREAGEQHRRQRSPSATCAERGLRPTTVRGLSSRCWTSRILPYFGEMPLRDVTLSEIKAWRRSLDPKTESSNAAAYRLLRSLLQAAEEEELIDRAPPKIRGAGTAPVKQVAVPATFDEIAVIVDDDARSAEAAHRARGVRRPARGRTARAASVRRRRRHRPHQRDAEGRQGRQPVGPRRLPRVRSRDQLTEDRERSRGRSTSLRRSCRCCSSTCSSTPPRDRAACSSPATAPTT